MNMDDPLEHLRLREEWEERVKFFHRHHGKPMRCEDCGGNCFPECGKHPKGCIYGGFSYGYWLVAEGCKLDHK
jgi:hypothetical protein